MAENVPCANVEEQPLAALKSTFNVSEHAEAPADADSSQPLGKRLVDNKPNVRKAACAELASLFEEAGEDRTPFEEHAPLVHKLLLDNASLCHENALLAAAAFAKAAPAEVVLAEAKHIATAVVEKHAHSGKAVLQAKATEVLASLVEAGAASATQPALVAGAAHKVPKVRAAAAKVLAQLVRSFRPGVLDLNAISPVLAGICEHREKAVRDEGAALVGELRLIRGDGFLTSIKGLPKDKADALKEAPLPGPAGPDEQRCLRGEALAGVGANHVDPATAGLGEGSVAGAALTEDVKPFDLYLALQREFDPRAKAGTMGADKWSRKLASDKWTERKEAAELLSTSLAGKTKLVSADYTEVAKGLKQRLGDSNLNVVAVAIRAMGALAAPLGKDFASHAKRLAPALFEKGGVKNSQVVEAVKSTLDTMASSCLLLEEAIEIAKPASGSKDGLVQACAVRCVRACLLKTEAAAITKQLTPLKDFLLPLTDGSTADVRTAAFETFSAACGLLESAAAASWLDLLPPKKSARVQELLGLQPQPVAAAAAPDKTKLSSASEIVRPTPPPPPGPCPSSGPSKTSGLLKSASSLGLSRGGASAAPRTAGGGAAPRATGGAGKQASGAKGKAAASGEETWAEPALPSSDDLAATMEVLDLRGTNQPWALRDSHSHQPWALRDPHAHQPWALRDACLAGGGHATSGGRPSA